MQTGQAAPAAVAGAPVGTSVNNSFGLGTTLNSRKHDPPVLCVGVARLGVAGFDHHITHWRGKMYHHLCANLWFLGDFGLLVRFFQVTTSSGILTLSHFACYPPPT